MNTPMHLADTYRVCIRRLRKIEMFFKNFRLFENIRELFEIMETIIEKIHINILLDWETRRVHNLEKQQE